MNWDDLEKKYGGTGAASGGSWGELEAKYTKQAQPAPAKVKEESQPVTDFSGNLRFATPFGTLDTRIPLPQFVNKGLAQFGSGMADWGMGARQMTGNANTADAAEKRALDAKLNDSFVGKALNLGGQVAPSLAIPAGYLGVAGRAAPIIEGALAGGVMGAFQPVVDGESRGANLGLGAVGGAAIPAAVAGVRQLAKPADAASVALADKYGIPVGVADSSQNRFLQGMRSVLNDTPVVGIGGRAQDTAKQDAFNRAVGQTFGADATKLTPQVLYTAKGKIGSELDRIWNKNALQLDPQFLGTVQNLRAEAAKLPQGESARLNSWIDDILGKVQTDANGNAIIPGDVANRLQSKLGNESTAAQGFLKENFGSLRSELIGAFNRSVSGADADALTLARSQYKNFKTVQPLLDKGAVGTAGRDAGDVPAALLSEAVRKSFPNLSANTSPPALAELAQVGSKYVANRVPQTGGAPRALIQNGLLGGALTGGGLSAGLMPTAAAVGVGAPVAAGLNQMLGSSSVRRMLNADPAIRGLLSPAEMDLLAKEAFRRSLMNAPAAALPGFLSVPAATLE